MTLSSVPRSLQHRDAVSDWLLAYLSGGARTAAEIKRVSAAQGFGWRTVVRAKKALGIVSLQRGRGWSWSDPRVTVLPVREPTTLEVLQELKNVMQVTVAQSAEKQQAIDEEPEEPYVPEPFVADVNWLMQRAAYFRQPDKLGDDPMPDEEIERNLVEIATSCPCDPPLSAEVIRSIARGTYKKPAATAAVDDGHDPKFANVDFS